MENNPCYNDELGSKMDEIMSENSVDDAPSELRKGGEDIVSDADWQAVCSEKDFAFRNWYDGEYLCKRQSSDSSYYCLLWIDEGAD